MAENKTLVNIAGEIPEEKRTEIALEICQQYDDDLQSRSEWEENRDKWYKLWACIRDKKSTPWPGASNVCIPLLATAANQFHARSYQSIFAAPGMVKAIPQGKNDVRRARNVEKYMNWQIIYEMTEYEEVFDKLLQQLPINGVGFKKLYYDKTKKRMVSEYISPLDLVLPYKTKDLETARRITHRIWLHLDELDERNRAGLYQNYDKIIETPTEEDKATLVQTEEDTTGVASERQEEKPHLILECHKTMDLGDGYKPYIFTVHYDSQTLLRVTSRLFKGEKIDYFTDYHFIPNSMGFYSFGLGHFLEPLNEMANTAFNQIFDSGRLSNQPFGFYGRRAGFKSRKIKLTPGLMTEVEDAKQVYFPSMQRVDQVLFMVLAQIQQYVETFTSTSDYITGRESKGTKTPTAHGTLAIIEQGLITFSVMAKRIVRSLRKELRLLMALNQIFLPDTKEFRIMGSKGEIAFKDIKKAEFNSVADIMPIADPAFAAKSTRRQEAIEKYQLLMGNPLIVGNPELGMKPNMRAMHEVLSGVLETYEDQNKSKILPPLPPEPMTPEEEHSVFMQGDYTSPTAEENFQDHIAQHRAFVQTEDYAKMKDEFKPLLENHVRETVMLVQMIQQKMAQERSQNVGGEQGGGQGMAPGPGNARVF